MVTDPTTPEEWRTAVDLAEACVRINNARIFGLVVGGPEMDLVRCQQILERGRARGITPSKAGVDAAIVAFASGAGDV